MMAARHTHAPHHHRPHAPHHHGPHASHHHGPHDPHHHGPHDPHHHADHAHQSPALVDMAEFLRNALGIDQSLPTRSTVEEACYRLSNAYPGEIEPCAFLVERAEQCCDVVQARELAKAEKAAAARRTTGKAAAARRTTSKAPVAKGRK